MEQPVAAGGGGQDVVQMFPIGIRQEDLSEMVAAYQLDNLDLEYGMVCDVYPYHDKQFCIAFCVVFWQRSNLNAHVVVLPYRS